MRYGPWLRRTVPLAAIQRIEVVPHYPVIDRAWGTRRGQALRLWLNAGDLVLLGTQRPDELRRALQAGRAAAA